MKKTRLEQMQEQMIYKLEFQHGQRVASAMEEEYRILCRSDADYPQDLIRHLHKNIFPVAAAFRALMRYGMERDKAAELTQTAFLELMAKPAAVIRRFCRIPGVYRLIPGIFAKFMPKLFKADAGFVFRFHPSDRNKVKFDMIDCPYCRVCSKIDCPELAAAFCTTDDICYGNMHPRLSWNRTQTIARGGDICDFELEITDPEK